MSQSTDQIIPDSLPDPETNPLQNPLLAANMGRWAEVYFTTPPEKRSEAVSELLRELRNEQHTVPAEIPKPITAASQRVSAQASDTPDDLGEAAFSFLGSYPDEALAARPAEDENTEDENAHCENAHYGNTRDENARDENAEEAVVCSACGYHSPPRRKFCGMCGTLIEPPEFSPADSTPDVTRTHSGPASSFLGLDSFRPSGAEAAREFHSDSSKDYPVLPSWSPELEAPHFSMDAVNSPYRYRLYVGAVLVVLLGGLIFYMARGSAAKHSAAAGLESVPSRNIPDAPSVAPPAPAAAEKTPVLPVDNGSRAPEKAQLPPPDQAQGAANDRAANVAEQPQRRANAPGRARRRAPPVPVVDASAKSANLAGPSGVQDFATAQKFLSGTAGMPRDSRQASLWLWSAVRKGNLPAAVTLSDLYLRGDGVAKNCDQARLLLDAAARKGAPGAGLRLRNLQAFGCQ